MKQVVYENLKGRMVLETVENRDLWDLTIEKKGVDAMGLPNWVFIERIHSTAATFSQELFLEVCKKLVGGDPA